MPTRDLIDATEVERFRADLARLCDPVTTRLLVAVSGGGDSLALLLLAHAALGDRVEAATVDHGLRPAARAEAAFVAGVCRGLNVPHATLTAPLPARVGRTANVSARARALRYRLLDEHAEATRCTHIATGHHADDQLETMVMRLNRGAGVAGLAGIRAKTASLVRPLLGWRRTELATLVAAAGLTSVIDPGNTDDRYDRARLRKALADADWIDPDRWQRSAAAIGEAEDALAWMTADLLSRHARREGDGVILRLHGEPPEIVRRLLLACLKMVQPDIDPRGVDLGRLAGLALFAGPGHPPRVPARTLGNVIVAAHDRADGGRTLSFRPAPSRRPSAAAT